MPYRLAIPLYEANLQAIIAQKQKSVNIKLNFSFDQIKRPKIFFKKLAIFLKKLLTNQKTFVIISIVADAGVAQWQSS